MLARLDGSTRISVIIGTPIAQVRSPEGITREMQARKANALLVPMEVRTEDVAAVVDALGRIPNLDGITVTVPHKQSAFACCRVTSARAQFLGAVNVMRRLSDGTFLGDHVDGESLLNALRALPVDVAGKPALLIGAGGAGSAIALSLLEAGVSRLTIADVDASRRDDLVNRLDGRLDMRFDGRVRAGEADARGNLVIVNATPVGMREGDGAPLDLDQLHASMTVADVVTPPGVSALIAEARRIGCRTVSGREMFEAGVGLITDHMLGALGD